MDLARAFAVCVDHSVEETTRAQLVLHLLALAGLHGLDREVCNDSRLQIVFTHACWARNGAGRTLHGLPAVANVEELLRVENLLRLWFRL